MQYDELVLKIRVQGSLDWWLALVIELIVLGILIGAGIFRCAIGRLVKIAHHLG
jgi:hypothetical protein